MNSSVGVKGPQVIFETYLENGLFMIQRSRMTGKAVFWPRILVPTSGEIDLEWVPAIGTGTVYSITVTRARAGAHNIALVDLDEGVRMMTTIAGVEAVPIGTRVRARVEPGEPPRVVFDPIVEVL